MTYLHSGDALRVWDPGFFVGSLVLWRQHHHPLYAHTHPNQPPCSIHTTPTPTSLMWKSQKSTSMSRQCHWFALSTSNDVAGTWKWFFASSMSATHWCITPLHSVRNPISSEARQAPKHMKGKDHKCGSCSLRLPSPVG